MVVSNFPPRSQTHGDKVGGVASFTRNKIKPWSRIRRDRMIVLADIIDTPEVFEDENILIIRCWNRNRPQLYYQIFSTILKFTQVNTILWEFEFSLYGDTGIMSVFPALLGLVSACHKKNIIVMHQVLLDLGTLSGHIGLPKNTLKTKLMSNLLKTYYRLMMLTSHKIVVLENSLKKRLLQLNSQHQKVITIPHGVDCNITSLPKHIARQKINVCTKEYVILLFGYLTWYKGADLILKSFEKLHEECPGTNMRLILAGGQSLTQKHKSHYRKYYRQLETHARKIKNVQITGHVKEKDFATYFGAADIVVLPYRAFMSSSGILSLALSYKKPIALSTCLKKWIGPEHQVLEKDLTFFDPQVNTLCACLQNLLHQPTRLKKNIKVVEKLRKARSYEQLAHSYEDLIRSIQNQTIIN